MHIISKIKDDRDLYTSITSTNLDTMGGQIIADPLNFDKTHSILNDIKNDYRLFSHIRELLI